MVIKYSAAELITIGELVTLKECIARMPEQHEVEPQYHHVYVPPTTTHTEPDLYAGNLAVGAPAKMSHSGSFSADNFLEDYAQFQHHLSQSIQLNRDIHLQLRSHPGLYRQQQQHQHQQRSQQHQHQLSEPVAEFFKRAQQNFHPVAATSGYNQPDSTTGSSNIVGFNRARRLSEVEAELLAQLRGHIHV